MAIDVPAIAGSLIFVVTLSFVVAVVIRYIRGLL